ncbi:MAG: glycosyltransferase family 4 protein [Proteobacteria bacterium]|nr:glycosyltransferase family 4 protein [Pseudomonadota bacterium]
MKVLFLAINASIKGPRDGITYPFIVKEMKALAERGIDVFFLARHIATDCEIDGISYLSMDKLLESARWRRRAYAGAYFLRHLPELWRLARLDIRRTANVIAAERSIGRAVDNYDIDIIHTHFLWPSGEAGVISGREHAIPVIATLRGAELADRPDIEYGSMRSAFFRRATQISFPHVSHFTAPSRHLAEQLTQNFAVPADRVAYLPNGVEEIEAPSQRPPPTSRVRFLSIGRLHERKNLAVLIEAAISCSEHNLEIVIVGEGPLGPHLRGLIARHQLSNVVLHPEVSKQELYALIAGADCLVHPSLYEGMPNVVLESLALGRPCLVSDIPVHRELIEEGANGWLFDPLRCDNLSEKMRWIAAHRKQLAEMGDRCCASVQRFSLARKIDGYLRLYGELGDRKRPSSSVS